MVTVVLRRARAGEAAGAAAAGAAAVARRPARRRARACPAPAMPRRWAGENEYNVEKNKKVGD